jgi:hypothetical protein
MKITSTDLLLAFGLKKEDGDKASVPNLPKVDVCTHLTMSSMMNASAGLGTLLGVGLKTLRSSAYLILGHNESGFDENRQTILDQIDVLRAQIADLGFQEAKANVHELQNEAHKFIMEIKQKMAVTHGDLPSNVVKAVEDAAGAAKDLGDAEGEATDELAKLLFGNKKKDGQVH